MKHLRLQKTQLALNHRGMTGQLKCVFELNLPNQFSEVEIADDLLEQALSNHDESLSPVLSFQKPETDYSLLIPFELLYRSNTRHIRARGWIDLPADGRFIDGFEENFAKIATRRCKYVALVYGILRDKLEVSSHGGMVKSKADSRIYFQEKKSVKRNFKNRLNRRSKFHQHFRNVFSQKTSFSTKKLQKREKFS